MKFWEAWGVLVAIVGAVLALEATDVWPKIYYPAVALVYVGLVVFLVDAIRGRLHKNKWARIAIALVTGLAISYWTRDFVFATVPVKVYIELAADRSIHIFIDNQSRYNLTGDEFKISVDGLIANISQREQVGQGFNYFPEVTPVYVDTSAGKIFPVAKSMSKRARVVCDKIPRESIVELIVTVFTTDLRDPNNFPQNLYANRDPKWCEIKGEYRALGKTREFQVMSRFPNQTH